MAYDKVVDSAQLNADLTSVANAIRAKSGNSIQLAFPAGFVNEIGSISTGGTDLSTLEMYVADFVDDPPTIMSGALNTLLRYIVGR